jgi:hypothetical protein
VSERRRVSTLSPGHLDDAVSAALGVDHRV